ncbi:soleucyl-trna synthetase [Holotrichia oblita]|uniref:Soleucyl-trna synthetase n=1 Tax=Holotrichia oblita TaxID=644536 RepID=A0ACB9TUJ0_HOLOL|nr:soleucyl-trna synthetase [Holotrichia oblita]
MISNKSWNAIELLSKYKFWRNPICTFSSSTEGNNTGKEAVNVAQLEKKEVGKAMKAYLERAREHDEFMKQQNYEFQIGKRHLANMMGEDPETFTQLDIDVTKLYVISDIVEQINNLNKYEDSMLKE